MAIINGKYYPDGDYAKRMEALTAALKAAEYELLTLVPRITPQYRKSVESTIQMIRDALASSPRA